MLLVSEGHKPREFWKLPEWFSHPAKFENCKPRAWPRKFKMAAEPTLPCWEQSFEVSEHWLKWTVGLTVSANSPGIMTASSLLRCRSAKSRVSPQTLLALSSRTFLLSSIGPPFKWLTMCICSALGANIFTFKNRNKNKRCHCLYENSHANQSQSLNHKRKVKKTLSNSVCLQGQHLQQILKLNFKEKNTAIN